MIVGEKVSLKNLA